MLKYNFYAIKYLNEQYSSTQEKGVVKVLVVILRGLIGAAVVFGVAVGVIAGLHKEYRTMLGWFAIAFCGGWCASVLKDGHSWLIDLWLIAGIVCALIAWTPEWCLCLYVSSSATIQLWYYWVRDEIIVRRAVKRLNDTCCYEHYLEPFTIFGDQSHE